MTELVAVDAGRTSRRRNARPRRRLFGSIALGVVGVVIMPFVSATAVWAAEVDVVASIVTDGTAAFDADDVAGHDSASANGRVRNNDSVTYRIDFSVNRADATNVVVTAAVPAGMTWSSLPPVCASDGTPASSISADGLTLTCNVGDRHQGYNGTIFPTARVKGTVVEGALLDMVASVGDDSGASVSANPVPVVATSAPRVDLSKRDPLVYSVTDQNGVSGFVTVWPVTISPDVGTRGAGSINPDFSFTDQFTNLSANTRLVDFAVPNDRLGSSGACGPVTAAEFGGTPYGRVGIVPEATAENSVVDSGTFTCSTSGGVLTVSIVGAETTPDTTPTRSVSGSAFSVSAPADLFFSGQIALFTPDTDVPDSALRRNTITGFAPTGPGGAQNFGGAGEPTTNNSAQVRFHRSPAGVTDLRGTLRITPREGAFVQRLNPDAPQPESNQNMARSFGTMNSAGTALNTVNFPGATGLQPADETRIAGAPFLLTASTTHTGGDDVNHGPMEGCVKWDNADMLLDPAPTQYPAQLFGNGPFTGDPVAPLVSDTNGATYNYWLIYSAAGDPTARYRTLRDASGTGDDDRLGGDANVVIEYGDGGYADDDAMHNTMCDDGDSASGWVTDPSQLPGGADSVTKVRFRSLGNEPPLQEVGAYAGYAELAINLPMKVNPAVATGETIWAYVSGQGTSKDGSPLPEWGTLNSPGSVSYDPQTHLRAAGTANWGGDRLTITEATIDIDKASVAEGTVVLPGAVVPFTLTVTADGPSTGSIVADTLPDTLQFVPGSGSPAPTVNGQTLTWNLGDIEDDQVTITYDAIVTPGTAADTQISNTAGVTAAGGVSDSDTAQTRVSPNFSMFNVVKYADTPQVPQNTDLTWTLEWGNTGTSQLGDVDLIDVIPYIGDDAGTTLRDPASTFAGSLAIKSVTPGGGGVVLYTNAAPASISLDPQDATNVAGGATKWCAVADFGTAGCPADLASATAFRHQDTTPILAGETRSLELVLTPQGNLPDDRYSNNFGSRVVGVLLAVYSNTVSAVVVHPEVSIVKSTNGVAANAAPGVTVLVGSAVTWTYLVTNTGNVPLTNVTVTDDKVDASLIDCGDGSNVVATLEPDTAVTCTATGIATAGQYRNVGTVTGTPPPAPDGTVTPPISEEDVSFYFGNSPELSIVKSTNGVDANEAPGLIVKVGDNVTWTYVVTNTGNVPVTDVTVTDDKVDASLIDCGDGSNVVAGPLQPDDTITCTASGIATAGQYRNVGTVIGTPPPGTDGTVPPPFTSIDLSHYDGLPPTEAMGPTPSGLAFTGSVVGPVLGAGALILAAGLALYLIGRRRSTTRTS